FAEQNNLPIISLPNQLSWSDIIYPIVSRINKKQLRELENTHQVYEQFHQHLKKQGDLQDIAQLLHSFQEVPVTIFLRDFNQIVSTEEIITSKNEIENIISTSLSGTDQAIQRINWKKRDIAVKWIFNSDTLEGGIFLWGINSEFTTWRKAAIEQAAAIVALKIERLKAVSATFQRFRNEFISNLLESENVEQDVLLRRAKEMDWELKNNYKVLILDCYFMNQTEKTNLSTWKQKNNLLELLKSKLIPLFPEILLGFDRNNHFALLITDTIYTNNFLHELGKVTFNLDIMQMIGGIGRLKTVVDLKSSYKEANLSLRVAHKQYINSNNYKDKRKSQPFIKSFSDLIVERIIFSKNPKDEVNHLAAEYLQKVINYDNNHNSELMHTLQTYFSCNGSIQKTAEALIIHKNTVRYRIERIEDLTTLNLKSLKDQLLLQMILTGATAVESL